MAPTVAAVDWAEEAAGWLGLVAAAERVAAATAGREAKVAMVG